MRSSTSSVGAEVTSLPSACRTVMLLYCTLGRTSTAAAVICESVRSRSLGFMLSAIRRAASSRRLSSMRMTILGRRSRPGSLRSIRPVNGYEAAMDVVSSAARGAAALGGQALRAATITVAAARPAAKPLHLEGSVVTGRLERLGGLSTGAAWLDQAGEDEVLVRQSRAVGLPQVAPDIFGVAIRVPVPGGRHGDLLFASTGLGRLSRFTLTA